MLSNFNLYNVHGIPTLKNNTPRNNIQKQLCFKKQSQQKSEKHEKWPLQFSTCSYNPTSRNGLKGEASCTCKRYEYSDWSALMEKERVSNQPITWVFPKIGVLQNGWFIMENPIKIDNLGVPLFSETSTCWIKESVVFFWWLNSGTNPAVEEKIFQDDSEVGNCFVIRESCKSKGTPKSPPSANTPDQKICKTLSRDHEKPHCFLPLFPEGGALRHWEGTSLYLIQEAYPHPSAQTSADRCPIKLWLVDN